MPTRRDATAPAPDRQTRARGGHEWIPCISSLGSSVPGLIPCTISLDAALLSSIYTKSFGEPSPLGRGKAFTETTYVWAWRTHAHARANMRSPDLDTYHTCTPVCERHPLPFTPVRPAALTTRGSAHARSL